MLFRSNLVYYLDIDYSTYLGSSGWERGNDISLDSSHCAYIIGSTDSAAFPTENSYQAAYSGGDLDVFITKLSSSGSSVLYSTYFGGDSDDNGYGIEVDSLNCIYICGQTYSTNFPTRNPYQAGRGTANPEVQDGFAAKLSPSGASLLYSTYLGGAGGDGVDSIALGSDSCIYLSGFTYASDFPTQSPYQANNAGGADAFISKLSYSGSYLLYSTYLGGSKTDRGMDITLDSSGSIYLAGWACSTDFPIRNPYQSSHAGGLTDAFLSKFSSSGSSLDYCTYLGGSGDDDQSSGIFVDSTHCVYISGLTSSVNFPTYNPYQSSIGSTTYGDAYMTKLSSSGSYLIYSTYLGGSGKENVGGMVVDSSGCAYISGMVTSSDFPLIEPYQSSHAGGERDAYITKFSQSGSALFYSTYLGGSSEDISRKMAVDSDGCIYITGRSNSPDFPTCNPYQAGNAGDYDAFVTKLKWDWYLTTPTPTPVGYSTATPIPTVTPTPSLTPTTTPTPTPSDADDDGILGAEEIIYGDDGYITDPNDPDTDGDKLIDGDNITVDSSDYRYNAWAVETTNYFFEQSGSNRIFYGELSVDELSFVSGPTNPTNPDTDGDSNWDGWEVWHGTDPTIPDSDSDPDGDGLINMLEEDYETDPNNADTDGDKLIDGYDVMVASTNWRYTAWTAATTGYFYEQTGSNRIFLGELTAGTDPGDADTDDDTIEDGEEIVEGNDGYTTDPTDTDTDGDGIFDPNEINRNSDPTDNTEIPYNQQNPVYSPDGTMLAFQCDGNGWWDIFIKNTTSNVVQRITTEQIFATQTDTAYDNTEPAWSRDTSLLYFASTRSESDGDSSIWMAISSTTDWTESTFIHSGREDIEPSISPDGEKIVYRYWANDIKIANIDDPDSKIRVCSDGLSPAWAPLTEEIAYHRSGVIYARDYDGDNDGFPDEDGSERAIVPIGSSTDNTNARWSPLGNQLVFHGKTNVGSYPNIWIVDNDGSNLVQLSSNPSSTAILDSPDWNPDNTRIIYHRSDDTGDEYELEEVNYPSDSSSAPRANIIRPYPNSTVSGLTEIIGTAATNFYVDSDNALSELDSYTLYYRVDQDGAGWTRITGSSAGIDIVNDSLGSWDTSTLINGAYRLKLVASDGTNTNEDITRVIVSHRKAILVCPGSDIKNPVYSPDGSRIAFQQFTAGNWEIFIASTADPSQRSQVTHNDAADVDPSWAPTGDRLAFCSDRRLTNAGNNTEDIWIATEVEDSHWSESIAIYSGLPDYSPAWSPTIERNGLLYIFDFGSYHLRYAPVDVPTTLGTEVLESTVYSIAWSPDGETVVYQLPGDDLYSKIIDSDGDGIPDISGSHLDLTFGGNDNKNPCYSPVFFGSQTEPTPLIAYHSQDGNHHAIWTIETNGTNVSQITPDEIGDIDSPSWHPDGTKILYHSNQDGNYALYETDYLAWSEDTAAPFPAAAILSPLWGATVQGTIFIEGTAADNVSVDGSTVLSQFDSYSLSYRLVGDDIWSQFTSSSTAVSGGILGTLNAFTLPGGEYDIKLEVLDTDAPPDRALDLIRVNVIPGIHDVWNSQTVFNQDENCVIIYAVLQEEQDWTFTIFTDAEHQNQYAAFTGTGDSIAQVWCGDGADDGTYYYTINADSYSEAEGWVIADSSFPDSFSISNVFASPVFFNPTKSGAKTTITYHLNRNAEVGLGIYRSGLNFDIAQTDIPEGPYLWWTQYQNQGWIDTYEKVAYFAQSGVTGRNEIVWDGDWNTQTTGGMAPLSAYLFRIDAEDANGYTAWYGQTDPNWLNQTSVRGDSKGLMGQFTITNYHFNFFQNQFLEYEYWLTKDAWVNIGAGWTDTTDLNSPIQTRLLEGIPNAAGKHLEVWDGHDAGGILLYGDLLLNYLLAAIPENHVVTEDPDFAVTDLAAEAYLIVSPYSHVSTIYYAVNKPAEVDIQILEPGFFNTVFWSYDTDAVIPAGMYNLEWDGFNNDDEIIGGPEDVEEDAGGDSVSDGGDGDSGIGDGIVGFYGYDIEEDYRIIISATSESGDETIYRTGNIRILR